MDKEDFSVKDFALSFVKIRIINIKQVSLIRWGGVKCFNNISLIRHLAFAHFDISFLTILHTISALLSYQVDIKVVKTRNKSFKVLFNIPLAKLRIQTFLKACLQHLQNITPHSKFWITNV